MAKISTYLQNKLIDFVFGRVGTVGNEGQLAEGGSPVYNPNFPSTLRIVPIGNPVPKTQTYQNLVDKYKSKEITLSQYQNQLNLLAPNASIIVEVPAEVIIQNTKKTDGFMYASNGTLELRNDIDSTTIFEDDLIVNGEEVAGFYVFGYRMYDDKNNLWFEDNVVSPIYLYYKDYYKVYGIEDSDESFVSSMVYDFCSDISSKATILMKNLIIDKTFGNFWAGGGIGVSVFIPTTYKFGLSSTPITQDGGNITSPTFPRYTPVSIENTKNFWSEAKDGEVTNLKSIEFRESSIDDATITHFYIQGVYRMGNGISQSGVLFYGALETPQQITKGTKIVIPKGAIKMAIVNCE